MRDFQIALVDLVVKRQSFAFHSVVFVCAVLAGKRLFGRNIQKYRAVGQVVFKGVGVDAAHEILPQAPCFALIGERGIDVAVAHDQFALSERRLDDVVQELYPRGGVEQRLAGGGHARVFGV